MLIFAKNSKIIILHNEENPQRKRLEKINFLKATFMK